MLPPETKLISVDNHITEPPNLWLDRLPEKYKPFAPRVIEVDDGRHAWLYESQIERLPNENVEKVAGMNRQPVGVARYDELRPSCTDPAARLKDMDADGVWAEMGFPQFSRFAGHRFVPSKDKTLALLCIQAYNDFVLDEWCATNPERLLALTCLPLWDVEASVAEIERCAENGARAIAFSEDPVGLGLPSIHTTHWDPIWAAVSAAELPITMHIGSSSRYFTTSQDAPWLVHVSLQGIPSVMACADWIFSGVCDRFPKMKTMLSEGGIGWVPYMLETTDRWFHFLRDRGMPTGVDRLPSEIFAEHVYVCFIEDRIGLKLLDEMPVDNIMWESDFPHQAGHWPHNRKVLAESLADVPDDIAVKIAETNARRLLKL